MSKLNFMLSWVEHDFFITSGPGCNTVLFSRPIILHFVLKLLALVLPCVTQCTIWRLLTASGDLSGI